MLAITDVAFSYPQSNEVLYNGLSHTFTPGAVTSVTGPSGCGKSTLLYILGLMLRPSQGHVFLNEIALSAAPNLARARARATSFGFVFQDSALDPTRSILDAVIEPALYAGWSRADAAVRARELMDLTQVNYRASHKPGQISGGQAQRVALARALINDPQVVLADEPTGNLDKANAEIVLDIFHQQAALGRTIIVVTHDPFVVANSDEILELT